MYDRTLWEPRPNDSLIYRMDGRTKIILLGFIALAAVIIDSPRSLLLLFWLVLFMHCWTKADFARWRILILFLLLSMWGGMVSQALFYSQEPRTEIACVIAPGTPVLGSLTGGVYLYREGILYGAQQALRSGIMLAAGLLVCWNTDPRQLLRVMVYWRMPYEFAFMLTTGMRFLPVVFNETAVVLTAQRLKGFKPMHSFSVNKMIQTAFQTLLPILARVLRRAEMLALSVESRGFGRGINRIKLLKWPVGEKLVCLVAGCLLLGLVVLKTLNSLQYNGLVYFPAWNYLYSFVVIWI
ncbi:MAG: ecfT 4 [Firmicutes bacterium]|nr:ecfT 4 [Bacillota bacterium]